jgi:ABC-2 type transport system ATP-binding protein
MTTTTSGAPAVRVTDLHVVRGGRVILDELQLTVARGTLTGLLGPSGCGKSTLLRSIVGVQKVTGGRIEVLGVPAGSAQLRRRVAYVTQAPSVYGDLSVRRNLEYFAAVLGVGRPAVDRVLADVALLPDAESRVDRLSGGQLNRVSLAAALLGTPELLVLDEPTVGLDPVLRRELWGVFHELAARGATLLVSSHVMDEAERCEELLLMRNGRILSTETPQDLKHRTGAPDVESAFLMLVADAEVPA